MKRFFLSACICSSTLTAQNFLTPDQMLGQINTIVTAVPFLRITPDARIAGMGESGIAVSDDANAIHWNPSKLAFNKQRFGCSVSYVPWLRALTPGLDLYYGAAYFKPDSLSAIGISFRYFDLGTWRYGITPSIVTNFSPFETAVDLAYARRLSRGLAVGITMRYIYSDIWDNKVYSVPDRHRGQAVAGDLGLTWMSNKSQSGNWETQFTSALALTNAGSKISYNDIDREFIPINLGVAQGAELIFKIDHQLTLQVQLDKLLVPSPPIYEIDPATGGPRIVNGQYVIAEGKDPNRSVVQGMFGSFTDAPRGVKEEFREVVSTFGIEYDYKERFKLRTGFFYEHATKGNRKFVTFGVGVAYNKISFDCSYLVSVDAQRSPLQNTMRFTAKIDVHAFTRQDRMQKEAPAI